MSDPFNSFNLSDFKKWINDHHDAKKSEDEIIGSHVKARPVSRIWMKRYKLITATSPRYSSSFLKMAERFLSVTGISS